MMLMYYFLSFGRNTGSVLNLMPPGYMEGNNHNMSTRKYGMTFPRRSYKTNNRKHFSMLHNSIVKITVPEHDRYKSTNRFRNRII